MTKRGFATRLALGAIMLASLAMPAVCAQDEPVAEGSNKAGSLIKLGEVLSGELNVLRSSGGKKGKRGPTYQLTSEPHRLPSPGGLCGLETGPQTFQIVINNDADVKQLKSFVGKAVSLRIDEVACAEDAGQMSEAVVTKWSVVKR
jgi:hypothetical protein